MTDVEMDPTLLAEVMEECRKDCPHLPDYLVWISSVDMIMRCKGYDNERTDLYHQAKEELEKNQIWISSLQISRSLLFYLIIIIIIMKLHKYKQVCRSTFVGCDDELGDAENPLSGAGVLYGTELMHFALFPFMVLIYPTLQR